MPYLASFLFIPSLYPSLALGMDSEGYGVVVSVCLSVKSHSTLEVSLHPENAVMYSAGDKGQNICGIFSETALLPRSSAPILGWPYIMIHHFSCG